MKRTPAPESRCRSCALFSTLLLLQSLLTSFSVFAHGGEGALLTCVLNPGYCRDRQAEIKKAERNHKKDLKNIAVTAKALAKEGIITDDDFTKYSGSSTWTFHKEKREIIIGTELVDGSNEAESNAIKQCYDRGAELATLEDMELLTRGHLIAKKHNVYGSLAGFYRPTYRWEPNNYKLNSHESALKKDSKLFVQRFWFRWLTGSGEVFELNPENNKIEIYTFEKYPEDKGGVAVICAKDI